MRIKNKFFQLWLIIGIVSGFVTVIFFVITYLNEKVLCNLECREKNEVLLILILLSLFGLFIGSLSYYFISEKYQSRIVRINSDAKVTLNFLEPDMKRVVEAIIKNNGKMTQSDLVKETKMPRVKISRILLRLEQKNLIRKNPFGMTNTIFLKEELHDLFLEK